MVYERGTRAPGSPSCVWNYAKEIRISHEILNFGSPDLPNPPPKYVSVEKTFFPAKLIFFITGGNLCTKYEAFLSKR